MSKISELSDGGSLLPTDDLIVVRSGGNVRVKADTINVDQIRLGDNEKIELGNAQDLQIYHDASHSFIKDAGTGHLKIQATNLKLQDVDGNNYIDCIDGSYVRLMHNTATKLETTSTGIDVTGTVTADALDVSTATGSASPTATELKISSSTSASDWSTTDNWGVLGFYSADTSGGGAGNRAQISTNMETATGAYSSLDFTLANPSNAYAQDSWLKLQNSASSSERKVIVSTDGGLDVTGTVTADGLTVNGATAINSNGLALTGASPVLTITDSDTNVDHTLSGASGVGNLTLSVDANNEGTSPNYIVNVGGSQAFRISDGGDISFYEDTGTTPKFFWDASAESLGIGTDSPGRLLELKESSTGAGDAIIRLRGNGNNANNTPLGSLEWFNADSSGAQPGVVAAVEAQSANANGHMGKLLLKTHDGSGSEAGPPTTRMTIDQSGKVGIGTDSPTGLLHLSSSAPAFYMTDTTNNTEGVISMDNAGSLILNADLNNEAASSNIRFAVDGSEAMRIDGGSVGINVTDPIYSLEVQGQAGIELFDITTSGKVLNFRPSLGDANKYNMSISAYDHSGGGTSAADGLSINAYDGVSISTGSSTARQERMRITESGEVRTASSLVVGRIGNRQTQAVGVTDATIVLAGNSNVSGAGEEIGKVAFYNQDASGYGHNLAATIKAVTVTSTGAKASLVFSTLQGSGEGAEALEAMRLTDNGNLLVGTTDKPSDSVHGGTMISRDLDSEANKTSTSATTGVTHFVFFNPNGSVGSISTNGSATAYNTSSDQRLKENIADAPSASDDIDAIQVRSFDWKVDGSHQKYGMVAQELQTVAPEAVSASEDPDEMMGVDYSKLVPMMLKEIQSLRARVAQLES